MLHAIGTIGYTNGYRVRVIEAWTMDGIERHRIVSAPNDAHPQPLPAGFERMITGALYSREIPVKAAAPGAA